MSRAQNWWFPIVPAVVLLAVCVSAILRVPVIDNIDSSSDTVIIPDARVPPSQRRFNSSVIENVISNITKRMKSAKLATLFRNTFPNTLDTTVMIAGSNDSFVITGDIDAMWLRDSTNQVLPYVPFASQDENLTHFLHGLVLRQLRSVVIDSYANAFNVDANGNGHPNDLRKPPMTPSVFEGKYEIDSLCSVLKLAFEVVNATGVSFLVPEATLVVDAVDRILTTFEEQQESTAMQNGHYPYEFFRIATLDSYPRLPVNFTGLVRSAFRPSDDRTVYDFLIPANAMLVVSVQQIVFVIEELMQAEGSESLNLTFHDLKRRAKALQEEVGGALREAQLVTNSAGVFAYEIDGFGHFNLMDDANVPNLLSLPHLGFETPWYSNIRQWVLSSENPWYFEGTAGRGVGSPHTGADMIWPMSVIMQALTSTNDTEIVECLEILLVSANNTGFMHESFNKNNVAVYTRPWFAWANTLFGSLITTLAQNKPHLIFSNDSSH